MTKNYRHVGRWLIKDRSTHEGIHPPAYKAPRFKVIKSNGIRVKKQSYNINKGNVFDVMPSFLKEV